MSIQRGGASRDNDAILQTVTDIATKVFQITIVTTILLLGWLLWGMFSGKLADTPKMPRIEQAQALQTVQMITTWLRISLIVNLISVCILFYEVTVVPVILLSIAGFLAFGLQYIADFVGVDNRSFRAAGASATGLKTIYFCAMALAVPGVILIIRNIVMNVLSARNGDDLVSQYGQTVTPEENTPRAALGVIAKCWQLPFCRAGVRKTCPIYHARTKCWKQQVGCMCEENIIRLSMRDDKEDAPPTVEMQKNQGFVAIGDLITNQEKEMAKTLPTKAGPRGVRIPVNPNLTPQQKKQRCHNCIIYNEHQREKYKFFAPVITLLVPLLVYLQYKPIREMIKNVLNGVSGLVSRAALTGTSSGHNGLTAQITGSFTAELILIIALTLVILTYALRALEYCVFKIKI